MKILLIGATGQIGQDLHKILLSRNWANVLSPSSSHLDLLSAQSIDKYLQSNNPDLIINAAAYTDVNKSETFSSVWAVNADAPRLLAEYAKKRNIGLIHYSTDYVFDGYSSIPYTESDATNPVNAYGRSKQGGEIALEGCGCKHIILRTSWVYSSHGDNFVKTMLSKQKEDSVRVINSQVGAPTSSRMVAGMTVRIIEHLRHCHLKKWWDVYSGIYHVVPSGEVSRPELAREIFKQALRHGLIERSPIVNEISSEDMDFLVQRPENSRLATNKIQRKFGISFYDWRRYLEKCIKEISENNRIKGFK
jgi:dTDP-4-dehydrorhamnose reductase